MDKLVSVHALKEIIQRHNFRFSKGLGQNFLIDRNILEKIIKAADIDYHTGVIEIGPGIGTLTQFLAEKAGKVVAIELDDKLMPILAETLSEYHNVTVIHGDALKVDIDNLINHEFGHSNVKVVANLPYYITTPIIMRLLEKRTSIDSITVMVQKEVAKRMTANPGDKDYSALSIAVQYFSIPKTIITVSPHCFIPQPKVESMVVRLDLRRQPAVTVEDEKRFFQVVKAAFGQRRKTLINALYNSGYFQMSKEEISMVLEKIGIGEKQRGETLGIAQFAALSNSIY